MWWQTTNNKRRYLSFDMLFIIAISKIKNPLNLRFKGFFIFDNYAEIPCIKRFNISNKTKKRPTVFLVLLEVDFMSYVNPHAYMAIISGCYDSSCRV